MVSDQNSLLESLDQINLWTTIYFSPVKSSIGPTVSDNWISSILSSSFLNIATLALNSDNIGSVEMNSYKKYS